MGPVQTGRERRWETVSTRTDSGLDGGALSTLNSTAEQARGVPLGSGGPAQGPSHPAPLWLLHRKAWAKEPVSPTVRGWGDEAQRPCLRVEETEAQRACGLFVQRHAAS